jgi:hypothetical protein
MRSRPARARAEYFFKDHKAPGYAVQSPLGRAKENSRRDAHATRLQISMPRSIAACSIAQISNGDRQTMLLLIVHFGRSTILHNERGRAQLTGEQDARMLGC